MLHNFHRADIFHLQEYYSTKELSSIAQLSDNEGEFNATVAPQMPSSLFT